MGSYSGHINSEPDEKYRAYLRRTLNRRIKKEEPSHLGPLSALGSLECKRVKTPFDAWLAVCYASMADVLLPHWAGKIFRDILKRFSQGEMRNANDEELDLDSVFGFRGKGKGSKSELQKLLIHQRDDTLCRGIWMLSMCGYKITLASKCLSRYWYQYHKGLDESGQDERFPTINQRTKRNENTRKEDVFANSLRQIYYKWRKQTELIQAYKDNLIRQWKREDRQTVNFNRDVRKYNWTDPEGNSLLKHEITWEEFLMAQTAELRRYLPSK